MVNLKSTHLSLAPFYLLAILLTTFSAEHFFFWDTIQLAAKHAHFFYENNFAEFFLPDEFDSGHIPAFGMYLALFWKLFGKSLQVSHWVMLPFLFGIVYQSYRLLSKFISPKYLFLALLIFLADATLLAQSILISPEMPLIFFFLLGINGIMANKRWVIMFATIGLGLISMRGMMVAFALGLIDAFSLLNFRNVKGLFVGALKKAMTYLPVVFLIIGYNYFHYIHKGWFAYHENSPWAESFATVDLKGVIYNVGLLIWRFMDFGRVFLVLTAIVVIGICGRSILKDEKFKTLSVIFIVVLASLSVSFITYKHLSGHRYLLPPYLCFALLVLYLIFEVLSNTRLKYTLSAVVLAGLLTGNLWIYPASIAQGWDASLAHTPYYSLRNELLRYLEQEDIAIEKVACTFPNDSEFKYMDLNDSPQKHSFLNMDENPYVLYSNVYNDFSDAAVVRLESGKEFILQKELKKRGIFLRLYKRNLK